MAKLTKAQKNKLNELSVWKRVSFPNGSSYKAQSLVPSIGTNDGNPIILENPKIQGWKVSFDNGASFIDVSTEKQFGDGVGFGKFFSNRDQYLKDLI